MILILSLADDPVGRDGEHLLVSRGVPVLRLDLSDLPEQAAVSLSWTASGMRRRRLRHAGGWLDLDDVRAIWHRRVRLGAPMAVDDPRARVFARGQLETMTKQLLADLDVPILPAPWAHIRSQQTKLRQLSLASRLGFAIPPTLVTSVPGELVAFYREHHGRCISKLINYDSMEDADLIRDVARFTEAVTTRDLRAYQAVRHCPVLVQAAVEKRVELRVTVVGEQVFAAAIDTQARRRTGIDSRKQIAFSGISRTALPPEAAARCVALTRALGLRYGAIDLIVTPDGGIVFLELNPAGEYHWIEKTTGMPITRAICDELVSLAEGQDLRRTA